MRSDEAFDQALFTVAGFREVVNCFLEVLFGKGLTENPDYREGVRQGRTGGEHCVMSLATRGFASLPKTPCQRRMVDDERRNPGAIGELAERQSFGALWGENARGCQVGSWGESNDGEMTKSRQEEIGMKIALYVDCNYHIWMPMRTEKAP